MAFAAFAEAPVDVAVVEVGMGGTLGRHQRGRRAGRGDHPDRPRPHRVPRHRHRRHRGGEGRDHQAGRRTSWSRPTPSRSSRKQVPEAMEVLLRRSRAGRRRGRPRGLRVRGAGPAGRRRRTAAGTAGTGRGVLRHLPAAARRTPGAQRRPRAGRRRGVLRRGSGPPTRRRRRAGRFRRRCQPGSTGANAQRANGFHRRRAQPGRCRGAGADARRGVRLPLPGRRGRR